MRKEWGVLALLMGLAGCVPPPQHRVTLDGAPWPVDAAGRPATGETLLLILVDYRGVPVEACIEKSSGNDVLDASAIKHMTTHLYQPEMKNGFPASSYLRVPVNFGSAADAAVAWPPSQAARECQPQPVPGISPSELALVAQKQFTVSPTSAGEVPGVGQPWPADANGKPSSIDAYAHVLVDPAGHIVAIEGLKPDIYTAFNTHASHTITGMRFAPSNVQHWEVVAFHFHGNG
ncbi:energy transducer TonB [Dyella agri]|uniref:Energy transducer TonB n=1 Tax=Dyella agri TaxID=1926869 RepID=A0ABW8KG60_9GAMM